MLLQRSFAIKFEIRSSKYETQERYALIVKAIAKTEQP